MQVRVLADLVQRTAQSVIDLLQKIHKELIIIRELLASFAELQMSEAAEQEIVAPDGECPSCKAIKGIQAEDDTRACHNCGMQWRVEEPKEK